MTSAIAPRQDRFCALCGRAETVGGSTEHHLIHRSMGGVNGPVLQLCTECHAKVHPEKEGAGWALVATDDWLYAMQGQQIVLQRPREYLAGDLVATMLGEIEAVPDHLERLSYHFDRLPDDAIEPIAHAVTGLHTATWGVIGRLLRVVKQRIPYGQKGEQFGRIAAAFDLSDKRAYAYIEAVDFAQAHPELFATARKVAELPVDVVLEAKKYGAPEKVLETFDALRADNPRAGVTALRRALRDGGEHQTRYCGHQVACPDCGRTFGPHEAGRL